MQKNRILAALGAILALGLASCANIDRIWDADSPGMRLVQRESSFIFEIDGAYAKAMGCTGYVLCPQARAALDARMKARNFCSKGYNVNSVSWNTRGQFYAHGPCQPEHYRWMLEG